MLKLPQYITRDFISKHRDTHLFVYADDRSRKNYRGQAEEAAGCDNAYPITTKFRDCKSTQAYFSDCFFDEIKQIIDEDLTIIRKHINGREVVLFPRIGEGQAELPERAPKLFKYIKECLATLHAI